ncbi:DMT family transporter [Streptomyces sp. NPDC049906]|uniref:DMT family transporter n=1 Tax=Streptomyces sp. NPDC049906 TaxID=3155656 RepID=UPI00341F2DEC
MSGFALAVVLSLVSAVAYAGGAIVQERVAAGGRGRAPVRRPAWWGAVGLNGVGALLHVIALAYGPLSLVQPLGGLTIVFALPMAALFVGRKAGGAAWRGAVMAGAGLAGMLALTGAGTDRAMTDGEQGALALATVGVLGALTAAGRATRHQPAVRALLLAGAAGVAFGIGSVFTKALAVEWTSGSRAWNLPVLAGVAVMATAGMFLSQAAYRGAGLTAPLATVTVANPAVAAAVGLTLLGESFRYGTAGTLLALGCGVVTAGGLILLTTERLAGGASAPDGAAPTDGLDARRTDRAAPVVPSPAGRESPVPPHRSTTVFEARREACVLLPTVPFGALAVPVQHRNRPAGRPGVLVPRDAVPPAGDRVRA